MLWYIKTVRHTHTQLIQKKIEGGKSIDLLSDRDEKIGASKSQTLIEGRRKDDKRFFRFFFCFHSRR